MKLDYDLTILDIQARLLSAVGLVARGWCGPVLDAGVLDRHVDRRPPGSPDAGRPVRALRRGARERPRRVGRRHRVGRGALRPGAIATGTLREARCGARCTRRRSDGTGSGRRDYDEWRSAQGMAPIDPRDYVWPVAPEAAAGGVTVSGQRRSASLSRSQTMSTPSFSVRTTLAGCCLSMWPTSPL